MATKEKSRVKRFKFLFFNVSINVNLFLLFIVVSQQKSISWKGAYPGKGVKNRSNGLYLFFTLVYCDVKSISRLPSWAEFHFFFSVLFFVFVFVIT